MQRIKRIFDHPDFQHYLSKNRQQEKERIYCGHDLDHLLTVARLTYLLLLEKPGPPISKELAYAAGLLHDIGRWKEYTANMDHALSGAELARPILKDSGFTPSEIEIVSAAISQHRCAKQTTAGEQLLCRALYEADLYSRLCFQCPARQSCYKFSRMPQQDKLVY